MKLKTFYIVLNFLILSKGHVDIIKNTLNDLEILKKLEFSNSELMAEAKDFEHAGLSYVWCDKNVDGLYWNTTIHELVYKEMNMK